MIVHSNCPHPLQTIPIIMSTRSFVSTNNFKLFSNSGLHEPACRVQRKSCDRQSRKGFAQFKTKGALANQIDRNVQLLRSTCEVASTHLYMYWLTHKPSRNIQFKFGCQTGPNGGKTSASQCTYIRHFTWRSDPTSKPHKTEDTQDKHFKPNSSDVLQCELIDAP